MKKIIAVLLTGVIALCVMAQTPQESLRTPAATPPPPPAHAHEMTATDVEAFLDGLVPLQIKQDDIAGVTIAVVKDGKLLFAKGYGYADVDKKTPVSAQDTLFRPG